MPLRIALKKNTFKGGSFAMHSTGQPHQARCQQVPPVVIESSRELSAMGAISLMKLSYKCDAMHRDLASCRAVVLLFEIRD